MSWVGINFFIPQVEVCITYQSILQNQWKQGIEYSHLNRVKYWYLSWGMNHLHPFPWLLCMLCTNWILHSFKDNLYMIPNKFFNSPWTCWSGYEWVQMAKAVLNVDAWIGISLSAVNSLKRTKLLYRKSDVINDDIINSEIQSTVSRQCTRLMFWLVGARKCQQQFCIIICQTFYNPLQMCFRGWNPTDWSQSGVWWLPLAQPHMATANPAPPNLIQ